MRSADCSNDARRAPAATSGPVALPRRRRLDLLREFVPVIGRADALRAIAHVMLSLIAALTGSVAAIVLVPLIQSGHAPMFGGHVLALPANTGVLASIFVASMGSYVLLRWFVSGLGARIISDCAMRLRGSTRGA
jgi:ATP-binding cassette subfamily C protein